MCGKYVQKSMEKIQYHESSDWQQLILLLALTRRYTVGLLACLMIVSMLAQSDTATDRTVPGRFIQSQQSTEIIPNTVETDIPVIIDPGEQAELAAGTQTPLDTVQGSLIRGAVSHQFSAMNPGVEQLQQFLKQYTNFFIPVTISSDETNPDISFSQTSADAQAVFTDKNMVVIHDIDCLYPTQNLHDQAAPIREVIENNSLFLAHWVTVVLPKQDPVKYWGVVTVGADNFASVIRVLEPLQATVNSSNHGYRALNTVIQTMNPETTAVLCMYPDSFTDAAQFYQTLDQARSVVVNRSIAPRLDTIHTHDQVLRQLASNSDFPPTFAFNSLGNDGYERTEIDADGEVVPVFQGPTAGVAAHTPTFAGTQLTDYSAYPDTDLDFTSVLAGPGASILPGIHGQDSPVAAAIAARYLEELPAAELTRVQTLTSAQLVTEATRHFRGQDVLPTNFTVWDDFVVSGTLPVTADHPLHTSLVTHLEQGTTIPFTVTTPITITIESQVSRLDSLRLTELHELHLPQGPVTYAGPIEVDMVTVLKSMYLPVTFQYTVEYPFGSLDVSSTSYRYTATNATLDRPGLVQIFQSYSADTSVSQVSLTVVNAGEIQTIPLITVRSEDVEQLRVRGDFTVYLPLIRQ